MDDTELMHNDTACYNVFVWSCLNFNNNVLQLPAKQFCIFDRMKLFKINTFMLF